MTSFIVDSRWTEQDFDRLEEYVERTGLDRPVFTILTPLPGTGLYETLRGQITV